MDLIVYEHADEFKVLAVLAKVVPVSHEVIDVRGCHFQRVGGGWAVGVCDEVVTLNLWPWGGGGERSGGRGECHGG